MKSDTFITGLGVAAIAIGFSLLTGVIVWPLWNWLMPAIFSLPRITFLQALGLTVLCNILFKISSKS